MKPEKWITQSIWVNQDTGEILTKRVGETLIKINQVRRVEIKEMYNAKLKRYETYGIITYTNECTERGRQRSLFE